MSSQVEIGLGADVLWLAILISVIYLLLVRLLDLNEREPLWAILMFFGIGAFVGVVIHLSVSSLTLVLDTARGVAILELARFVAFGVGFMALEGTSRWRGWSEIGGVLDGVVYGAAVGFGMAVGGIVAREGGVAGSVLVDPLTSLWTVGLFWLSQGLFGALIGAGFGLARGRRKASAMIWLLGCAGTIVATVTHFVYRLVTQPRIGSGAAGLTQRWIGLAVPILLVGAFVVTGLVSERRAIAEHLRDEPGELVSERDLELLDGFWARRKLYMGLFWRGRFDDWLFERTTHNHVVRLALIKTRMAEAQDGAEMALLAEEAAAVRASITMDRARRIGASLGGAEKATSA